MFQGAPHAFGDYLVKDVKLVVVFHSHQVCFIDGHCWVWNVEWSITGQLFHLLVDFDHQFCTVLLAIAGDIGLNELLDFFSTQTFGALRGVQKR